MARRRKGDGVQRNPGESSTNNPNQMRQRPGDSSAVQETPNSATLTQSESPPLLDPMHIESAESSQAPTPMTNSKTFGHRLLVYLRGKLWEPSGDCSRAIRQSFEERQDYLGFQWKKTNFYWDKTMKKQVREAWDKKVALLYSDMLNDIKDGGKKPKYMEEETYERWLLYWDSPDAKKISEQNSKNRKSGSDDGSALATHTGGSATHHKHAERLAAKLGRKPFPREVPVHTHTKKGDGKTFINQTSMSVNDTIEAKLDQLIEDNEEIDELSLYYDSVGEMNKKKCILGLGSEVSEYYTEPSSPTDNLYATQGPEVQETILELKQKVAEQQQLIEDMQQQQDAQRRQLIEEMQQQFSDQLQRQIDERIHLMIGASLE